MDGAAQQTGPPLWHFANGGGACDGDDGARANATSWTAVPCSPGVATSAGIYSGETAAASVAGHAVP